MAGDRSIGELFSDLTQNLRVLIRQEIALARAELTQSASRARRAAVLIVGGLCLAWIGGLALVAGLCFLLWELGLPPAAATLLVGGTLALAGYLLIRGGRARLGGAGGVAPRATVETLRDNAQLLKGHIR
jgi:hypothetical protein